MPLAVDISLFGDKELERKLKRLEGKAQKRIVKKAMRRSSKRIMTRVAINASGRVIREDTGALSDAIADAKPKSVTRRGVMSIVFPFPTRAELNIPAGAKGYYPAALEYGTRKRPPRPFIRKAVNDNMDREIEAMRKEMHADIKRLFGDRKRIG